MLPPMCAWILANGQPCNQFALRRNQFCRAHVKLARVENSNQELRELLDLISTIDIHNLISLIQHILNGVTRHSIAPARAQTIFNAVQERLTAILEKDAILEEDLLDDSADDLSCPDPSRPAPGSSIASRRPRPADVERILGPDAKGVPIPPGIDLNDIISAKALLNPFLPMNSGDKPLKTDLTPAPLATSTLTPAK